jgi:KDO2-lipid IV(A) lauroyltransferase
METVEKRHRFPTNTDFASFCAFSALQLALSALPLGALLHTGDLLGLFFYYVLPIRRSVIVKNLILGFPDLDRTQREVLVEQCYRFMGKQLCILARGSHLNRSNLRDNIDIDFPAEYIEDLRAGGVILTSGHVGMWELCPLVHNEALKQKDCLQIYQPLHNKYMDRTFLQIRARCGNLRLVSTWQPSLVRILQDALLSGAVVGLVADQRPSKRGIAAPFLGVPTMFSAGMGVLHERTKCPVWFTALLLNDRKKQGRSSLESSQKPFSLVLQRITPKDACQWTAAQVVQRYADQCSMVVRDNPYQYLWLHDRWKAPIQ